MAQLLFKVSADYEKVIKLREEIAKLKQELISMDIGKSADKVKVLEDRLGKAADEFNKLTSEAAKAGAEMEMGLKKKIFDASQTVNVFSEKITFQRGTIQQLKNELSGLKDKYREALKQDGDTSSLEAKIKSTSAKLRDQKDTLFNLTQQQANARLSVKKLRDEYELYNNDGKNVVATNENMAISWKKALAVIGGVAALKQLSSAIIRVRGEFQSMQTAIETMVGKDRAGQLIPQIKELAKISPLTMTDMVGAEKMMLGFNIQAEDTIKYLKALSDISMGESGKFNSLTLAFSQMSAAGKLMGQDLNQMINAGFNPLQVIAEKTGKSIATLKDEMSKGAISAEMVQQAFIDATSAGGKFYGMSENASKTINGQISMMQDAWDNALNEIGQKSEGFIMGTIQGATKLIQNYEKVGKVLVGLIVTLGIYKTALLVTDVLNNNIIAHKRLSAVIGVATKAVKGLSAAMKANPYVLATTLIVGVVSAMWAFHDSVTEAEKAQKRFNNEQEKFTKREEERKRKIEDLIHVIKDETETEYAKIKAYEELQKYSPALASAYKREELAVASLADANKKLNEERDKINYDNIISNIDRITKEINKIDKSLALGANRGYLIQKKLGGDKKAREQDLNVYQKELEKINQLKKEAEEKNKPLDIKLIEAKADLQQIEKEFAGVKKKLESEQAKLAKSPWMVIPFDLQGEFYHLHEKLKEQQKKVSDLEKQKSRETNYKQDYNKAKKEWEDAKKALAVIEKDKDKFTTKQYEDAKKRKESTEKTYKDLGGTTGSALTKQESEAEKQKKDQQKLSDDLLSLRRKNQQDEINLMKEGTEKKIAQIELDYQKEVVEIKKLAKEWASKQEGKLTVEQTVQISTALSNAKKTRNNTLAATTNQQIETAEAAMRDYLIKYGTYKQQQENIAAEYAARIAKAEQEALTPKEAEFRTKLLQKEMKEALSMVDMEQLKKEMNWEGLFGNLAAMTKQELDNVKKLLDQYKKSKEYKNSTIESKKEIEEAYNKIEEAINQDGGLLGGLLSTMREYEEALKELSSAQEEYDKALLSGVEEVISKAREKLTNAQNNVVNKRQNVSDSQTVAIDKMKKLSGVITELGNASELTLSDLGNLTATATSAFSEAAGKIGGIIGAILGILDSIGDQDIDTWVDNIATKIFTALGSAFDSKYSLLHYVAGDLLGSSDKSLEEDIERLIESNKTLREVMDTLADRMKEVSIADATDEYDRQKQLLEEQIRNTQEMMQRSGAAYSNGFLGIGGSHSSNRNIDKAMSSSDWEIISKIVGRTINSAGDFWTLTSKEMAKVKEEATELYIKIKSNADDGYKNAAQYMDEYIKYYKELEELENNWREKLTSVSFNSVRDDFKNTLLDMKSDTEDFVEDFEKLMQNAMIESLMTTKYDKLLQDWYENFANAMNGGELSKDEQTELKKQWNDIINQGIAERDALKELMGWTSSSIETQTATRRGVETITQDQAGELTGRITDVQGTTRDIKAHVIQQTETMSILNLKAEALLNTNNNIRNIADETRTILANSYLELRQISDNTGAIITPIKEMNDKLEKIQRNTENL